MAVASNCQALGEYGLVLSAHLEEEAAFVLAAIRDRALLAGRRFRLSSGKESDYYLDMKLILNDAAVLRRVAALVLERVPPAATAIGGLAMGALPISTAVILLNAKLHPDRPLRGFWVRPDEKTHGPGGRIGGELSQTDRVVIVDDVTTGGNSILKAIRAVEEKGARILKIVAVVDREEGASEAFRGRGVPFEPLFTKAQVLGR